MASCASVHVAASVSSAAESSDTRTLWPKSDLSDVSQPLLEPADADRDWGRRRQSAMQHTHLRDFPGLLRERQEGRCERAGAKGKDNSPRCTHLFSVRYREQTQRSWSILLASDDIGPRACMPARSSRNARLAQSAFASPGATHLESETGKPLPRHVVHGQAGKCSGIGFCSGALGRSFASRLFRSHGRPTWLPFREPA